jgi:hypothetical protein
MRGWHNTSPRALPALVLAGIALVGCGDGSLTAAQCRDAWEDLRQTQGENGSLAPDGTATDARWDEEYAAAQQRAAAPGDPGSCRHDVAAAEKRFANLVTLSTAITRHDLSYRLVLAERDLGHAMSTRDYDPLPAPLARAFPRLREAAPAVTAAIAPVEARAADLDLGDDDAVEALAADIEDAATSTPAYDEGRAALEVIGRFELSEE